MPQLRSGRHFALSINPYLEVLTTGADTQRYFAAVALRLNALDPQALQKHLVVLYFVEGQGTPPNAPSYDSGFSVIEVLNGEANWTAEEIEELRQFMASDQRFAAWLQDRFQVLDEAIRENDVWEAPLLDNDLSSDAIDVPMIKRVAIRKAALEPTAMRQLREVGGALTKAFKSAGAA